MIVTKNVYDASHYREYLPITTKELSETPSKGRSRTMITIMIYNRPRLSAITRIIVLYRLTPSTAACCWFGNDRNTVNIKTAINSMFTTVYRRKIVIIFAKGSKYIRRDSKYVDSKI
jgi:hypothetical protein